MEFFFFFTQFICPGKYYSKWNTSQRFSDVIQKICLDWIFPAKHIETHIAIECLNLCRIGHEKWWKRAKPMKNTRMHGNAARPSKLNKWMLLILQSIFYLFCVVLFILIEFNPIKWNSLQSILSWLIDNCKPYRFIKVIQNINFIRYIKKRYWSFIHIARCKTTNIHNLFESF